MTNHPNRSTERVTITNLAGDCERVTLPQPHFSESARNSSGYNNTGTGTWITALYAGPRTGRKFIRTHSIWDRGDGATVGTTYRELAEPAYLAACERVGCEPEHVAVTDT